MNSVHSFKLGYLGLDFLPDHLEPVLLRFKSAILFFRFFFLILCDGRKREYIKAS
jgi:hypothetical protein